MAQKSAVFEGVGAPPQFALLVLWTADFSLQPVSVVWVSIPCSGVWEPTEETVQCHKPKESLLPPKLQVYLNHNFSVEIKTLGKQ